MSQPLIRAAAWMAGWMALMLAMTATARELSAELPVIEIMAVRSWMAAAVISPFILWSGGRVFATTELPLHVLRNGVHFVAQFLWFLAVALIPLAEVVSIEFTMPIWTAIMAALFLGERITPHRVIAIFMGFAGILVVLRPGVAAVHPGALAILVGAVGFALVATITKKLTRSDKPITIIAYMFIMQALLSAVVMLILPRIFPALPQWVWPSQAMWPWIAILGVTGSSSHYCMTKAMSCADASVVVPMDFLRVPLTAIMGFALYGEPLSFYVFAGAGLIMLGNLFNLRPRRLFPASSSASPKADTQSVGAGQ